MFPTLILVLSLPLMRPLCLFFTLGLVPVEVVSSLGLLFYSDISFDSSSLSLSFFSDH